MSSQQPGHQSSSTNFAVISDNILRDTAISRQTNECISCPHCHIKINLNNVIDKIVKLKDGYKYKGLMELGKSMRDYFQKLF